MTISENYKLKGLRKKLVSILKNKGISDERVLEAIGKIPRHVFLDSAFGEQAYEDKAFPIGSGQTISQPFTVAYQTEKLLVEKGYKVLEIGTGSGYQACVLLELGAKVFSVERIKPLYERTRKLLNVMGYFPQLFYGDGTLGLPQYAPYDRIIVTAASPTIPETLLKQLKPGGIMIIPTGTRQVQKMLRVSKIDAKKFETEELEHFRFVPLIGKEGWEV